MKTDELPTEMVSRLDELAGMKHSTHGRVMSALAELITMYQHAQPRSPAAMLAEWSQATGGDHLSLKAWAKLRKDLLQEEVKEACDAIDHFVATGDARPMAKELADVEYVAQGAALRPRIDLAHAFRIVHKSNMTKIHPDGTYRVRPDGKILKPDSYAAPDMTPAIGGTES